MTLPVYPAGLPHPLREGYGFDPENMIQRTPMATGRARQRVRYTSAPTFATLRWLLATPGEANLLEAWAIQVAAAGWFEIELTHPTGKAVQEVRFIESLKGPVRVGVRYWSCSARVEIRNRPQVAPGWAEVLPDAILHADILDAAVNREWPAA